jgi:hypothetical protein
MTQPQPLSPPSLQHPARWLALFGPGAIVASLTIGAGELVFSSRGGALFGYRLLGLFLLTCVLKWSLVFATARHFVLSGAHPFQRWCDCPGPRGWLPMVFLLLGIVAFPIWVGFHAGTVGTLLASLTDSGTSVRGAAHFIWGIAVLILLMPLVLTGGYRRLERIQLAIVALMLLAVLVSVFWLQPDIARFLSEALTPLALAYPDWADSVPGLETPPLWVELATYVSVVGGSGYDYLAYVAFLRDKQWGAAGGEPLDGESLANVARTPAHPYRRWVIAPLVDATLSFLIVLVFSAVFLTCGAEILRPQQSVPGGSDLLTLQAEFVATGASWLRPLYFAGALLAMLGTLYGTIEVAPTIAHELQLSLSLGHWQPRRLHRFVSLYVMTGAIAVLIISLVAYLQSGAKTPPGLIAILAPAGLFTGVLACGIISLLAVWSDYRHLPAPLRMPIWLQAVNVAGGILFLLLGLKAYWDHNGWTALLILSGTVMVGMVVCSMRGRRERSAS